MVGNALGSSWTTILAKRILNSAKVPKICVLTGYHAQWYLATIGLISGFKLAEKGAQHG